MLSTLTELFVRDLEKLKSEIQQYRDENALWVTGGEIANSAGNLCLHLVGNLNHFIGATLGYTGYVRQRELEFSQKNVPRQELLDAVEQTIDTVRESLGKLTEADLHERFPLEKHGQVVTTGYMLLHLQTHLNYHLGQINYHRRLLDEADF
ncbi:MAG: DinB family protein [Saprospiraceae bacterium]|nr:DinB family protein [Saprospiraceae bacterium]